MMILCGKSRCRSWLRRWKLYLALRQRRDSKGVSPGQSAFRGTSFQNIDRRADGDEAQQILRVPICEPKAAVRFGTADFLRAGRAMNTVAGLIQTDPGDAHGVVRAGTGVQLALQGLSLGAFGYDVRIER